MPIEIKELIVRTTIETDQGEADRSNVSVPDFSKIVTECVHQVLEIIKQQKER